MNLAEQKKIKRMRSRELCRVLAFALLPILSAGCLTPPNTDNTHPITDPTATPTMTPAGGVRAAKIIFKVPTGGSDSGSFDAPSGAGTVPAVGLGLQATRVFNADGSLLSAAGADSPTWPKWLAGVEVGVSGALNTKATNSNCARFAAATDAGGRCYSGSESWNCNAPAGYYRVSEYDCLYGATPTTQAGTGGKDDGVYVRAFFSREAESLDPSENILAVIEYSASGMNGPTAAANCFPGGIFKPESCNELTWQIFLRANATDSAVPPYLMMIPPLVGMVNTAKKLGGTGVTTRQVMIPLASDTSLQVFQLSRIGATPGNQTEFETTCSNNNNGTGNSPLCMGVVLYSITFFRI
ncbi:MAG: hypothetical protein A2X94_01840 [Bdellovibrionales bacterium GWB1_55_8]|nr:MAG: hypothetical protein A2X94_01840 [Bdellovibrionales bacterium GWB1_55_8]